MPMNKMTRRQALSLLAVSTGSAMMSRDAFAQAAGGNGAELIPGAEVCVITPEAAQGPFYFDPALVRTDIAEGRPGLPTTLRLQVVDAQCRPLHNARVDIWHCDAIGIYSGYPNQTGGADATGETFMRGTQFTDESGIVAFATVYPGWYRGRTTHIHFKVFLDETTLLTGQLFFPDEVSEAVYATAAPYNERPGRDTFNDNDSLARRAGERSVASVAEASEGYLAQLIIGVEPPGEFGGMSAPSSG
jgi:protocatechuate 3,4-dioxygenase beta subunit